MVSPALAPQTRSPIGDPLVCTGNDTLIENTEHDDNT